MQDLGTYPFGAQVRECGVETPDPVDAFVLGAYPSAVHVRWTLPQDSGSRPHVTALAVDNEPSVFWDGSHAEDLVAAWAAEHFDPSWGSVAPARLNGPAGQWLRDNILVRLSRCDLETHFVTDCLTTYRLSTGADNRVRDTYNPFAEEIDVLRPAQLKPHPTENQIVSESLDTQSERICRQIEAAHPERLVTLGNAAGRVIASLSGSRDFKKLTMEGYGTPRDIELCGQTVTWVPLAHPAAPKRYQEAHAAWLGRGGFCSAG